MRRFAVIGNYTPADIKGTPFIRDNFDVIEFKKASGLDYSFMNGYEFIWVYYGSSEDVAIARHLRQGAPSAKILWEFDNDGGIGELPENYRKEVLPYVDAFARISFREKWDFPNYYVQRARRNLNAIAAYTVPFNEREDKVAIMYHFGSDIRSMLETLYATGLKANIFTSLLTDDIEYIRHSLFSGYTVKEERLKPHKLSPHMHETLYLPELARCKIALEDPSEYKYFSRFVMECAMLGIPVVGGTHIMAASIMFPELTTIHGDIVSQVSLLKLVLEHHDLYERYAKLGKERALENLSEEHCTKLLIDTMAKMGVKV